MKSTLFFIVNLMTVASGVVLDSSVASINTLDEARTVNKLYHGDVRVEEINGTYAMIQDSTSKHIATVGGEALNHLTRQASRIETPRASPVDMVPRADNTCTHNSCAIVSQCGQGCAFCYPVICV